MTKKRMPQYDRLVRQGDVLLQRIDADDSALKPAPKDARGIVLAEGETSGHHHAVFGRGAKLMQFRDTSAARVLVVGRGGAELRVVGGGSGGAPRHEPVCLAPGKWAVRVQKTWSAQDERALRVHD
jgi:hypothetical protein